MFRPMYGFAIRFHSIKTGKKLVHLSNDLSFAGEVQIVLRIRDQDDTSARHAAPEGIGPGGTACCVVRNQSGFAIRLVGRKAVPVVRAGIYSKCGNRNACVLLCAEGERGTYRNLFLTSVMRSGREATNRLFSSLAPFTEAF